MWPSSPSGRSGCSTSLPTACSSFTSAGALRERDTEHLEQVAIRIVAAGLGAIGVAAVAYSGYALTGEHFGDHSTASVVLAALSVCALTALALRKRRVALTLPSRALLADGTLTAVGAVLAAVTLVGIVATERFGWWWADPTAALAIGAGAIVLGVVTARSAAG